MKFNLNPFMKRTVVTFIVSLFLIVSYGQNPLPALKAYQYNIDNNKIDLDKEFEKKFDEVIFTNVFFKYYKNPMYSQTFSKHKIMLFRVQYEFMLQTIIKNGTELSYQFRFNEEDDKVSHIKLTYYRQENGKTISEKVSKKDFEKIITKDLITIKPLKTVFKENDMLRITLSIESSEINLKDLSSLNKIENAECYVALNKPEIFNYVIDNTHLDLLKNEETQMTLIKFAYDVSRLTEDSNISSTTLRWKIKKGSEDAKILFPLTSINLPPDIGTSADEIINKGK